MSVLLEKMKSRLIAFRIKGEDLKEFEILKARLKLNNLHGEESLTIRKAVRLANKHLDLKERIKKLFEP